MGEARRRRIREAGQTRVSPIIVVKTFEAGERDLSLGEITTRTKALFGERAFACVDTSKSSRHTNPLTGKVEYVKRFCIARYKSDADNHLPDPQRRTILLGQGVSWAEAFARAEIRLRGGRA